MAIGGPNRPKILRGFAVLSPDRRREIARLGGEAAQASGEGHRWTTITGKAAGKKGGAKRAARVQTPQLEGIPLLPPPIVPPADVDVP